MALIKCIECGTEISDRATACVKCGAPLPSLSTPELAVLKRQLEFSRARKLAGTLFFCGALWLIFAASFGGSQLMASAWGLASWPIFIGIALYFFVEIERNLFERKLKKQAKAAGVAKQ